MEIFLDTANLKSIRHYNEMGMVDGITTNPTLLSKEDGNPEDIMHEIVNIVKGPVNLEVIATVSKYNLMLRIFMYIKCIKSKIKKDNHHTPCIHLMVKDYH